jgi:pimeloyl-ACP methyl ester carboxylesterase
VRFDSGRACCVGRLHTPGGSRKLPCVILAHGFGLTQDTVVGDLAIGLAHRGLMTLTFDYRHFGESAGDPRQLVSVRRQRSDLAAALRFVRNLDSVDARRIALWGYSYGAGHALYLASRATDVAALALRAPFVDGLLRAQSMPARRVARLTTTALRDQLRGLVCTEPAYLPLVGSVEEDALYTTPKEHASCWPLVDGSDTWQNRYAPRGNLYSAAYRPIVRARRLRCPILVSYATSDTIAAPATAVKLAKRTLCARLEGYPADHFSINIGAVGARVAEAEAKWLAATLRSDNVAE